jgi:hypothetical protein
MKIRSTTLAALLAAALPMAAFAAAPTAVESRPAPPAAPGKPTAAVPKTAAVKDSGTPPAKAKKQKKKNTEKNKAPAKPA